MAFHRDGVSIREELALVWNSNSKYMSGETSSHNLYQVDVQEEWKEAEIKQLVQRLRLLEDEAVMLKGVLLESVQETTQLIAETYKHLETLRHVLTQSELQGQRVNNHGQMIPFLKERRAGLLQILCQESNPWLVKREIRANPSG